MWPCRVELASLGQGCVVRDITPIVQAAQALGLPEMFDMTLQAVVTTVMAPVTYGVVTARSSSRLQCASSSAGVTPSELLRSLIAVAALTPPTPEQGDSHVR